jgi:hypothetical protein
MFACNIVVPAEGIGICSGIENTEVKLLISWEAQNAEKTENCANWTRSLSARPPFRSATDGAALRSTGQFVRRDRYRSMTFGESMAAS